MKIIISGTPYAKKRHRTNRGRTYDPQHNEKINTRWEIKSLMEGKQINQPCFVKILAYFPRPKSHYRTGKYSGFLKVNCPKHHTTKPDIDNIAKFYLDCGNGIVYSDDKLVTSILVEKAYSNNPRTEITIQEHDI